MQRYNDTARERKRMLNERVDKQREDRAQNTKHQTQNKHNIQRQSNKIQASSRKYFFD